MNILFFDRCATARDKNGIGKATAMLAEFLRSRGDDYWFLGHNRDLEAFCHEPEKQLFLPKTKRNQLYSAENRRAFEQILDEKHITHVIFQWGEGRKFPFVDACRSRGVPVITCLHFTPDHNFRRLLAGTQKRSIFKRIGLALKLFRLRRKTQKIYEFNLKNSAAIVLLSARERENYLQFCSAGTRKWAEKIVAIPNALPFCPTEIDFAQKQKELLFVGRLDNAQKRVNWLLQIWAKIEKEFPQWTLKIVGDGKDRANLEELAGTLNLRERVEFCGFQNPAELYRRAAIFCMTSAYEGFGLVLVEAQAFACVPVAFDSFATLRDIITDVENGMIVPAFDLEKYAQTLAKLMRERDLRERLALAAQRDVSRFSPEKIYEKWALLFNKIHTDLFESNDSHGNENSRVALGASKSVWQKKS